MKKQIEEAGIDDSIFKKQQAIISSMTRAERKAPKLLNMKRKQRVAAGSGTSVQEINKLLKMHQQMAGMMKKMSKQKGGMGGMMQKMMGGLGGGMPGGLPGLPGGMGGGMGGGQMPDLANMDPKELERMAQQMGVKLPKGLPGKK